MRIRDSGSFFQGFSAPFNAKNFKCDGINRRFSTKIGEFHTKQTAPVDLQLSLVKLFLL